MEKTKLKLGDVLQLESEINGFTKPDTGEELYEGFLKQNLSIILKYELTETAEFLTKERKKVEGLRDELIKKYGKDDGKGGLVVKMFDEIKDEEGNITTRVYNEEYLKFDEEYAKLLDTEIDVEHPEISKDDLKDAGKTNDKYRVLFKLLKK